jgi:prepilin-type N-terminal cleavage/methylation domain-containing protein
MRKENRNERGFTLLESVIVIAIMMVLMGVAVIQSFGSLSSYQANSAEDIVVSQLRVARQLAISQRRTVQIWIDTAPETDGRYHIAYQVLSAGTFTTETNAAKVSVPLPGSTQFILETGVPDTPMKFGNNAPVYIGNPPVSGGPPVMQFNSTGTFTDSTGVTLLYGTIFIGITGEVGSARAVTIMGGTGRVRGYSYVGGATGWQE